VELVVIVAKKPTYQFEYATPTGDYEFSLSIVMGVGASNFDAVKFFKNLKSAAAYCRKSNESCAEWGARLVSPGLTVNVEGVPTSLGGRGICSLAGAMATACVTAVSDLTTGGSSQSAAFCESVKCPEA